MQHLKSLFEKAIELRYLSVREARACLRELLDEKGKVREIDWRMLVERGHIDAKQLRKITALLSRLRRQQEITTQHAEGRRKPVNLRTGGIHPGAGIGPFTILKLLGSGGMGSVYLAEQNSPRRQVALKLMTKTSLKNNLQIKRFLREAQLGARLEHPNIVKVYLTGIEQDVPYLAMSYVQGRPLHHYLQENKIELPQKLTIIATIARALAYAHQLEILHRDIKPANIMIEKDGTPVLMDFGLAKSLRVYDRRLTRTGEVLGTPGYISPEQAQGARHLDARTDIYSLGCVLYLMLTGRPVFSGENQLELLYQLATDLPVLPRTVDPSLPESVEAIVLKSIEKDKQKRYADARELAADIDRYLQGRPVKAFSRHGLRKTRWYIARYRKVIRALSVALSLCLVGVLLYYLSGANVTDSGPALKFKKPNLTLAAASSGFADIGEEIEHLKNEIARKPSPDIYLAYIEILRSLRRYDRAIKQCDRAIDAKVGNKRIWQNKKLELLWISGKYRWGYKFGNELLPKQEPGKNEFSPPRQRDAQLYVHAARFAFAMKRYEEVIRYLEKLAPKNLRGIWRFRYDFYYAAARLQCFLANISHAELLHMLKGKNRANESSLQEIRQILIRTRKNFSKQDIRQVRGNYPTRWQNLLKKVRNYSSLSLKSSPVQVRETSRIKTQIDLYSAYARLYCGEPNLASEKLPQNLQHVEDKLLAGEIRALSCYCQEQYGKTIEHFGECIKLRPWESKYYHLRAQTFLEQIDKKNYLESLLRDCTKSLQLLPSDLSPICTIATALSSTRRLEELFSNYLLINTAFNQAKRSFTPRLFLQKYRELSDTCMQDFGGPRNRIQLSEQKIKDLAGKVAATEAESVLDLAASLFELSDNLKRDLPLLQKQQKFFSGKHKKRVKTLISLVQKIHDHRHKKLMQQYLARFFVGRDTQVRKLIREDIDLQLLSKIMNDSQEPILLRYWATVMLAELRCPLAYRRVKKGTRSADIQVRTLCLIALARTDLLPADQFQFSHAQLQKLPPILLALLFEYLGKKLPPSLPANFLPASHPPYVRLTAARALLQQNDPRGIPVLAAACKKNDQEIKTYGFWWLWQPTYFKKAALRKVLLGKNYLRDFTAAMHESPRPMVRLVAAATIGKTVAFAKQIPIKLKTSLVNSLVRALQREKAETVRLQILDTLVDLGYFDIVLKRILNPKETYANRVVAFFTLIVKWGLYKDQLGVKQLIRMLSALTQNDPTQEEDPRFASVFIFILGRLAKNDTDIPEIFLNKLILSPLLKALSSEKIPIRRAAAHSCLMVERQGKSILKTLQTKLATETNQEVKCNLIASITHLTAKYASEQEPKLLAQLRQKPLAYRQSAAYGYYHFVQNWYYHIWDRWHQGYLEWGYEQEYLLYLKSAISHMCYTGWNIDSGHLWTDAFRHKVRKIIKKTRGKYENLLYLAQSAQRVLAVIPTFNASDLAIFNRHYLRLQTLFVQQNKLSLAGELTSQGKQRLHRSLVKSLRPLTTQIPKLKPEHLQLFNANVDLLKRFEAASLIFSCIEHLENAIKLDPDKARYYFETALLCEYLGEWQVGLKNLDQALRRKPQRKIYRIALARMYLKMGNTQKAEVILKKLKREYVGDYSLLQLTGELFMKRKRWSAAEQIFQHLHLLDPVCSEPKLLKIWAGMYLYKTDWAKQKLSGIQKSIDLEEKEIRRQSCSRAEWKRPIQIDIYRLRGIQSLLEAILQLRQAPNRAIEYCISGNNRFIEGLANYALNPFTRENLDKFSEFQKIKHTNFMRSLPLKIQGLTDYH